MARLRAVIRSTVGDEVSQEDEALAEAQRQGQKARQDLQRAEAARLEAMERALDGDVDASVLARHEREVAAAKDRLAQCDRLIGVVRERQQRATANRSARERMARMALFRKHVDGIAEGFRKILAGLRLLVEGVAQVRRETHAAREAGSGLVPTENWPMLLRPDRLSNAINAELVRQAGTNDVFTAYPVSMVVELPPLEEQARAAVSSLVPPAPEPRPLAA